MKFLVFCAILTFVSTTQVQVDDNVVCSVEGPSYWCKNKENAKKCQATNYCMEHVWKQVTDDTCTECQQYVTMIHDTLANNDTRAQIMKSLDMVCSLLPSELQSECQTIVNMYGNQAYDMILQMLADPKTICTEIGLCSGTKVAFKMMRSLRTLMKSFNKIKQAQADECTTCEQYVGTIHMLLSNNETKTEILNELIQLCQMAGVSSSECTIIVDVFGQKVLNALIDYLADPSKLCTSLGFCSSRRHVLLFRKRPSDIVHLSREFFNPLKKTRLLNIRETPCTICLKTVQFIQDVLNDTDIKNMLKVIAENLCSFLPPQIFSRCLAFVINRLPHCYSDIIKELNPNSTCTFLTLCNSSPSYNPLKINEKLVYKAPKNSEICEICTLGITFLAGKLKENSTQQELKSAVLSLCQDLPDSLKSECNQYVNTYFDVIMQIVLSAFADPQKVCAKFHLCSSAQVTVQPKKPIKADPVTCEVCKYAMNYLDGILTDNATEEEIKSALDKLCSYLPSIKDQCDALVNQYTDEIIKLIVNQVKPDQVCKEIGLCSSSRKFLKLAVLPKKKPVVHQKETVKANPVTCDVCKYAMNYLDGILSDNATEEEVKAALDKMCTYLPSSWTKECKTFVDDYSGKIIDLIVNELAKPDEICKLLELCSSSGKDLGTDACQICEDVVEVLDNLLEENRTQAAIKKALESACNLLPSSSKQQCVDLIDQYSGVLIDLLAKEMKPDAICKELRLCSSSKKVPVQKASIKASIKSSVTCELCNFAMGELISQLKNNQTENEIREAVLGLCSKLPNHLNDECKNLVDEYGEMIIKAIVQEVDPTAVCEFIGLCKQKYKANTREHMLELRLALDGVSCDLCQSAIGYLDSVLTSNSTEKEIEDLVMSLCSHLPDVIKNECDALITEYGDELIKLIAQQIKPDQICKELKLC